MLEDDVSMANWHLFSFKWRDFHLLQQLCSTFPRHVRFSSNVYHIIEAKHNKTISFDDSATERSPNRSRSQKYIPFSLSGGDGISPKGWSAHNDMPFISSTLKDLW